MRFLKASVVLAAVVLIFNSTALEAAQQRAMTGRVIFENSHFTCHQQCRVTLLAYGIRPLQTVLAGLNGYFAFEDIPRGGYAYTIRIEIDGYETFNHKLEDYDAGFSVNIIMPLIRKPSPSSTGAAVVDVSELPGQYPKKALSFFQKGNESLKNKDNGEAVQNFEAAVKLAPQFYEAHNQLGVAYREAGRLEDAEHQFLKAHELNSTNEQPLLNLTALYLDRNNPEKAVEAGEQATKANSRSAPAFFGLGVALYRIAQLDRAETALKRALDLAPKMGNVRLMLANVYMKLRRYDNTLEQLDSYIAENPGSDRLNDVLALRNQLLQDGEAGRP